LRWDGSRFQATLDLFLELAWAKESPTELRVYDSSLAIEHVRLGNRPAVVSSAKDLTAIQQDDVGQLLILDELRDPVFRFVRSVDRDDAQSSGAVFLV
jgi:hypothetical protein